MSEGIIISESETHGFFLPIFLAQRLKLEGIDVLLSPIAWPRDNLIIYSDGSYEDLSKDKFSKILSPHFAWHGGTFIKGDDFIIASSVEKDENKRDETHKRLGVSKGYYFDISDCLDSLKDLMILKNGKSFYGSDFLHIDSIFNLYNSQKKLITYQSPKLIELGEEIADKIGYELITLPLSEANYVPVGFVEVKDIIVIDKRAKESKKILENICSKVIQTPMDLRNTNSYRGSLHCMTTDLPFGLENLVFEEDFDKLPCPFEIPLLDLNGRYVKADSMNIYQN